jgi:hypothetical protein
MIDTPLVDPSTPALAVVLVTPGSFQDVRKVVRCLRLQTIRDRIELLIVTRSRAAFGADPEALAGFGRVELVEIGEFSSIAAAKAIAVGRATAPVIAFAEDHCFPEPDWGQALLAAHGAGWEGVGPTVRNANPVTAISRSAYLLHWATWMEPTSAGAATGIAWHNSSYRRVALLDLSADLPDLLAGEAFLQAALRGRGHRLYLEPAARVSHINISRGAPWLGHGFWGGRMYAAQRVRYERWSWSRRAQYAAGSPLIPVVRLWRLLRILHRTGRLAEFFPRTLPLVAVGLLAHALGEATGYLFGQGNAESHYSRYEMHRARDLAPGDLAVMRE